MAKNPGITEVATTDTFQTWLNKTNELVQLVNSDILTASVAGDTTTGNATLVGNFTANTLTANSVSGTVIGFGAYFSEIQQVAGNTAAIAVKSMLNITAANSTPVTITNNLGPKIGVGNGTDTWRFGANSNVANTDFIFSFNNNRKLTLSANGNITTTGSVSANGTVSGTFVYGLTGSAAIPTFSFLGDTTTGIYSSGASTMDFSLGGTLSAKLSTSSMSFYNGIAVRTGDGAAVAPAFSFTNDPNSGFYSAGADSVGLALGGNNIVTFSSNSTINTMTFGPTSNSIKAPGYLDLSADGAAGIRIGRYGAYSRMYIFAPGTTTTLIQFNSDDATNPNDGQIKVATSNTALPGYSFIGDQDTGISSAGSGTVTLCTDGLNQLVANTTSLVANVGMSFGSSFSASPSVSTRHISLYGSTYGINATTNALNITTPSTGRVVFMNATANTEIAHVDTATGAVRASTGTSGNASYGFVGDVNTGIFSDGSGHVGVTSNSNEVLRMSGSGITANTDITGKSFISGAASSFRGYSSDSEAAPAFTWTDDTDSGMYKSSGNIIGFAVGGTSALTISSSSIRIRNAGASFTAYNNGDVTNPDFRFDGATNYGMYTASNLLRFSANGVNTMGMHETYNRSYVPLQIQDGSVGEAGLSFVGDSDTGIGRSSGMVHVSLDGDWVGRFQANDTAANVNITVMTRIKGDARYSLSSSVRFKKDIQDANEALLLNAFDLFDLRDWIWGGEIPLSDERYGTEGTGLIAEEVAEYLPQAVRYQWSDDTNSTKKINALDPLPIISSLIVKIRHLEERLEELEG